MAIFGQSFARLMRWEGWVIENVAGDAGGETCCGISHVYNLQWEGWEILKANGMMLDDEVKKAVMRFYQNYYTSLMLDQFISQAVADQFFQLHVNIGGKCVVWLQNFVNTNPDSIIGYKTVNAVNETSAKEIVGYMFNKQVNYYNAIVIENPSQQKFIKGWIARAEDFMWKE